jgi:hypothetical protein
VTSTALDRPWRGAVAVGERRRLPAAGDRARTATHEARLPLILTAVAIALQPLTVPRGPGNLGPADAFIVLAIAAWLWSSATSGERLFFPYALAVGLMVIGGAVGGIAGPVPREGVLAIVQDLLLLGWCWTVANVASSARRGPMLYRVWAASSIAWSAALILGLVIHSSVLTGEVSRTGPRTTLTLDDPNVAANYFMISLLMVWAAGYPRRRSLRALGYVSLIVALISTGSNGGLASLAVGLCAAVVIGVWRRSGTVPAVACLALALLCAAAVIASGTIQSVEQRASTSGYGYIRDGIGRGEQSVTERTTVLGESVGLYDAGGPLGAGPVSTKHRLEASLATYPKEAHDDYFASLMERGIVGAVGMFILVGAILLRAGSLLRLPLRLGPESRLPHPNAVVAAVLGTLITMTVLELLHIRHVWTLFALLAATQRWERE